MIAAVITFPGSNCDRDAFTVLKGLAEQSLPPCEASKIFPIQPGQQVVPVWHQDQGLPDGTDLVVIPGGFSYGDYLRCGAMAANSPIMGAVKKHAENGGKVLGICNGFQILCEARLLPGTLMQNAHQKFVCKTVYLEVSGTDNPFTERFRDGQVLQVPVAHHEGNYYADSRTLDRMEASGQVAFRYCGPAGQQGSAYNPNGSIRHIAGVTNEDGNVLGMMPHPERVSDILTELFTSAA